MKEKTLEHQVAEFASRWRRELALDQVKMGKQLAKEKSKATANINSGKERRLVNGGYKSLTNVNNKIDQVSNSAKAQKASLNLMAGNKADPLLKQNKNLRSYLENRKTKQGLPGGAKGNVLSKPYQAPKTMKRAARPDAGVYKAMRDSPKRLAEIKAKEPQIPRSESVKPKAPKDIPNPLNTPKSTPVTTPALNKPSLPNKKFLTSKRVGIGLGVAGATALGAGIYSRMRKNKNK